MFAASEVARDLAAAHHRERLAAARRSRLARAVRVTRPTPASRER